MLIKVKFKLLNPIIKQVKKYVEYNAKYIRCLDYYKYTCTYNIACTVLIFIITLLIGYK